MYFSTLSVPASERLAAWQEALRLSCGEIVTDPGRSQFEASLDIRSTPAFGMARITHTAREGSRGNQQITGTGSDRLFFGLQIAGRTHIEHAGRTLCLNPGDVTVMDGALPLHAFHDRKNTQIVMYVTKAELAHLEIDWTPRLLRLLPQALALLIGNFLQSAFDHVGQGDSISENAIRRSMFALIEAAWAPREATPTTSSLVGERVDRSSRLITSIHQYIAARLADDTLSPCAIAATFHMSERQLHRTLATTGQSVGRIIRQARLDRCAADLRNPAQLDRSITDIAFSWGFNDAAHFSRQFRAEFEQSPSEYRVVAKNLH